MHPISKWIPWASISLLVCCAYNSLLAQDETDALRFSGFTSTGTARGLALGGATTALGADFSSAATNPAGLAQYRRSEFTFSPGVKFSNTQSSFYSGQGPASSSSGMRNNFGIASLGLVIHSKLWVSRDARVQRDKGLKSWDFAVGFNQLDNFYQRISVSGYNPYNSIADNLASKANGYPISGLDAYPYGAVVAKGIQQVDSVPNLYQPNVLGNAQQTYISTRQGRTNQWSVSVAGNWSDRLFVGLSVGIVDFLYKESINYTEADTRNNYIGTDSLGNDNGTGLSSLNYQDNITTRGTGVNLRLGLTYQISDRVRVALSGQTPTWAAMRTDYGPNINITTDNGTNYPGTDNTQSNNFSFNMTTPYQLNAGALVQLGKIGLVTVDGGMQDYSTAKLSPTGSYTGTDPFTGANQNISQLYTKSYFGRAGLELRYEGLYGRVGAGYYSSPYSGYGKNFPDPNSYNPASGSFGNRSIQGQRITGSLGIGYRTKGFFIDLAYVYQQRQDYVLPYIVPAQEVAQNSQNGGYALYDFSAGQNNGGLGGGISPIIVNKRTLSNFVLTIGLPFQ